MNSAQIHLALTHVPVILSLIGLVILVIAFMKKSQSLIKTSYFLLLFAGLTTIPVFFSGEGAEELVERLPGVTESIIEKHEAVAKLAMISIVVAGLAALAGLFLLQRSIVSKSVKVVVLLLALSSSGLMAQTAHLGGQIRHTEIRNAATAQIDPGTDSGNRYHKEHNDD